MPLDGQSRLCHRLEAWTVIMSRVDMGLCSRQEQGLEMMLQKKGRKESDHY